MSEVVMSEERESSEAPGTVLTFFVDHLMPLLKPYETSLYLYLYRHSHTRGTEVVRVGIRTISKECGVGTRSPSGGNIQHIREVLLSLEAKGCLSIGDRSREGTLYTVRAPHEIPGVEEGPSSSLRPVKAKDYFRDPELRRLVYDRDKWLCEYCGEKVTDETATLDHRIPVSNGGDDSEANLTTACLVCNSLKAGKTLEEAAPLILASVRARRAKVVS